MSENKRGRGIRTANYHYTLAGIWTAVNSGKLLRQHEELGLHRQPYEENGNIMLLSVNSERELSAVKMVSLLCKIHICGFRDEEQLGLAVCQYITIAWQYIYF